MKPAGWAIIVDEDHTILAAVTADDQGAAWERAIEQHLKAGGSETEWFTMKNEGWLRAAPCTDELLHDWARDGIDTAWAEMDGIACTKDEYDLANMSEEERESLDRETAADERYHYQAERDL